MKSSKTTKQLTKRQAVRHDEVTLITRSEEITAKPISGTLVSSQEGVYEFEQGDAVAVRFGERKWKSVRVDATRYVRVTKNSETGEYRIAYKLSPTVIKAFTGRTIEQLGDDFKDQLEKIYNVNA